MIRLTAYISGNVQRFGYRAKVVSLAKQMGLVGMVQNQPDGSVLVIAEGEKKDDLERFASAIRIENTFINVEDVSAKYSQGAGAYSNFKKVTGPNEVGEHLDDGIEILKEMLASLNNLTAISKDTATTTKDTATTTKDTATSIKDLTALTKEGLAKQDQALAKIDLMIDKQDETIEAISDSKRNDERFVRMEKDIRMIKNRLGIR